MRIQVMMTLPREARSVPVVRRTVVAALTSAGVVPECVDEVEVALSEACTNVFQHAGHGQSYEVVINIGDQQVSMDVLDSGSGFGNLPVGGAQMAEPTAEGGRGIALIRAFTDRAVFDSVTGGGGSVHLIKLLRWTDTRVSADGAPETSGFGLPMPAPDYGHTDGDGTSGDRTLPPSSGPAPEAAGGAEDGAPAPPAGT